MAKNKDKIRLSDKLIIKAKNALASLGKGKFEPKSILLVFSHCLQWSDCPHKITTNLSNCKRCGKCPVKDLIELSEAEGIHIAVATGGRLAQERATAKGIEAVVAIACEQELSEGIRAAFSKTIVAVPNTRPCGPCKDCGVDLSKVKAAVNHLKRKNPKS